MRFKAIPLIALLSTGGLFSRVPGLRADPESSPGPRVYCLRDDAPYGLRGPIYADRNGDGKIDWEVNGPGMMAEGTSCFRMDTNFDGYYDVKYWVSVPITGRVKSWSTNIHERVPEIGEGFVRIKRPNWVTWPEPSPVKHQSAALGNVATLLRICLSNPPECQIRYLSHHTRMSP